MEKLFAKYREKLEVTDTSFVRYLQSKISWDARLIAILGSRGVGKTTMLLQHIKLSGQAEKSLYVSADDIYFTQHTLVELANAFYLTGGKWLYIDEIHRHANWSQEIKNIYDDLPRLNVIYTGSSILDLEKGGADLSRRKLKYVMCGLSFREYLELGHNIKVAPSTLEDVINRQVRLPMEHRPLEFFGQYLREGYYPFFKEPEFASRLNEIINTTLELDLPMFANFGANTARKLKRLLYIIAQSAPFKPNMTKLSGDLAISRTLLYEIFTYMEKAGLIGQLRMETEGINLLGKVDKVYLDNTNLSYALTESEPNIGNIRETFFYSMTKVTEHPYVSKISDFKIKDYTFEVGGKSKGAKQIEGLENAYIVKDDIETAGLRTLPLWTFGMLY